MDIPSNKGISPLIAAVLLIAFTMTIATLVGPWASNLIIDSQEATTQDTENLLKASESRIEIAQTSYSEETGNLTVSIQNKGSTELENFTATVYGNETTQKRISQKLKNGEIYTFEIQTERPEKIDISSETFAVSTEETLIENADTTNTVETGPTAVISANTTSVETGDYMQFDASSSSEGSSSIENYSWTLETETQKLVQP